MMVLASKTIQKGLGKGTKNNDKCKKEPRETNGDRLELTATLFADDAFYVYLGSINTSKVTLREQIVSRKLGSRIEVSMENSRK